MTPRGGGPRPNAGRKEKKDSKRHNVILNNAVWAWLVSFGNASEKIEDLVKQEWKRTGKANERI